MRLSERGEAMVEAARRRVLRALEGGEALTVARLPRRWPETRVLLRHVLDELVRTGDVRSETGTDGPPAWRITPRGRSRLRGLEPAGD